MVLISLKIIEVITQIVLVDPIYNNYCKIHQYMPNAMLFVYNLRLGEYILNLVAYISKNRAVF